MCGGCKGVRQKITILGVRVTLYYKVDISVHILTLSAPLPFQAALKDSCKSVWLACYQMECALDNANSAPAEVTAEAVGQAFVTLNRSLDILVRWLPQFAMDPWFISFFISLTVRTFRLPKDGAKHVTQFLWKMASLTIGLWHLITFYFKRCIIWTHRTESERFA